MVHRRAQFLSVFLSPSPTPALATALDFIAWWREALGAPMHGSLLHGFKQFVLARAGGEEWETIARAAAAEGWYQSAKTYPDSELDALVQTTAKRWKQPAAAVLEDFGAALVPTLLGLYGSFVDPAWRTLDLLTNVENVIHRTVRMKDPLATPPFLQPRRTSPDAVAIDYSSERRLCAMAIGICRGVAKHYGESIDLQHPSCMNRGDSVCRLLVRVIQPASPDSNP